MREVVTTRWEFGGILGDFSAGAAALLLAVVLAAAVATAWWSYRHARQRLTPARAAVLAGLRAVFLLAVALCLANPTRIERSFLSAVDPRPVAVVIDDSGSMRREDNRGHSRLENALRHWREMESTLAADGREVRYYALAERVGPVADASATEEDRPSAQTRLFEGLGMVLEEAPAEGFERVLVLTDALDTTGDSPEELVRAAAAGRTGLSFLPGDNRLRVEPYLYVREWSVPARTLRQTAVTAEAVIDTLADQAGSLPVRLVRNGQVVAEDTLALREGRNVVRWPMEVTAEEPGEMNLVLEAGEGEDRITARARVDVVERREVAVLYYQGALDWGYRFLADILGRDPSFELDAVFNVGPRTKLANVNGAPAKRDLPESAHQLGKYQLLVLANVYADQLSAERQQALVDYVSRGGGVLFIAPDAQAAESFAGTRLEEMLPVSFEPPAILDDASQASRDFQAQMHRMRSGANGRMEATFAAEAAKQRKRVTELTPFRFAAGAEAASFLQTHGEQGMVKRLQPAFATYAGVRGVKPGARVLAVHPTETNPRTGKPRVLLATQRFGRGRSSVLTTDGLWRWKLSQPSESREVETFWQQFLLWLARETESIRFAGMPPMAVTGRVLEVTVEQDPQAGAPVVHVQREGSEETRKLNLASVTGSPGFWSATWAPPEDGAWLLTAAREAGATAEARHLLLARGEISEPLPDRGEAEPDRELMARLAAATGGEVLAPGATPTWLEARDDGAGLPVAEQRRRLWHTGWLMLLALGAYSSELVLRRFWRLV